MIAIVDSKAMAYLEMHANKPVVNLFDTVTTCLKRVEDLYGPVGSVCFAYDIGKSKYRLDLWEHYKGTRSYTTVPDTFKYNYETIVPKIAKALGITSYMPKEVEADDIAGILCNKYKEPVVLLTVDHDWFSLVLRHDHVQFFDVKKFQLLDKPQVVEKTGCESEDQFIIKKCILGDSGDHIIGIPTIGPVKYAKWADRVFKDPRGLDPEFLKEQFLDLCSSISTEHKTHKKYMYAGVQSCEDLLDYNTKLGTIMKDLSLLTIEQKVDIKRAYLTAEVDQCFDPELALELSREFSDSYTNPFGGVYELDPGTIDYFRRLYDSK